MDWICLFKQEVCQFHVFTSFYEIAIVEGAYENAKAKRSWNWGDLSVFFTV